MPSLLLRLRRLLEPRSSISRCRSRAWRRGPPCSWLIIDSLGGHTGIFPRRTIPHSRNGRCSTCSNLWIRPFLVRLCRYTHDANNSGRPYETHLLSAQSISVIANLTRLAHLICTSQCDDVLTHGRAMYVPCNDSRGTCRLRPSSNNASLKSNSSTAAVMQKWDVGARMRLSESAAGIVASCYRCGVKSLVGELRPTPSSILSISRTVYWIGV